MSDDRDAIEYIEELERKLALVSGALHDLIAAHRGASHALDGPVWKALEQAERVLARLDGK